MNWKFISAGITGALSLAGATSFYFLSSNPPEPPKIETKTFRSRFPSVKINGEFLDGKYNSSFWEPKIKKIKSYYSDSRKKEIKQRLIETMSKVLDGGLVLRHFDLDEKNFEVGLVEGRLLAQYCNKSWDSESGKFKGDEDIIEDLCFEDGKKFED